MKREAQLRIKIEKLRNLMHDLINKEENLLHSRVLEVSQKLDKTLNEYNNIIIKF